MPTGGVSITVLSEAQKPVSLRMTTPLNLAQEATVGGHVTLVDPEAMVSKSKGRGAM